MIKLFSYNYKHYYKNRRKIEVERDFDHWGQDYSIVQKFWAKF